MTDGTRYGSYDSTRECNIEDEFGETCYFYGDVEVFYDADVYQECWTCPECAHEHESGYDMEEEFDG
jgi:hypothetical protein